MPSKEEQAKKANKALLIYNAPNRNKRKSERDMISRNCLGLNALLQNTKWANINWPERYSLLCFCCRNCIDEDVCLSDVYLWAPETIRIGENKWLTSKVSFNCLVVTAKRYNLSNNTNNVRRSWIESYKFYTDQKIDAKHFLDRNNIFFFFKVTFQANLKIYWSNFNEAKTNRKLELSSLKWCIELFMFCCYFSSKIQSNISKQF